MPAEATQRENQPYPQGNMIEVLKRRGKEKGGREWRKRKEEKKKGGKGKKE